MLQLRFLLSALIGFNQLSSLLLEHSPELLKLLICHYMLALRFRISAEQQHMHFLMQYQQLPPLRLKDYLYDLCSWNFNGFFKSYMQLELWRQWMHELQLRQYMLSLLSWLHPQQ